MKDSPFATLSLPLVALLAIFAPFALRFSPADASSTSQQAPPVQATPAASDTTGTYSLNALALVCEFASTNPEKCQKYKERKAWTETPDSKGQKIEGQTPDLKKDIPNFTQTVTEVETLIATIPDPQESSFDYMFDRYLEAIQRALEATGHTIDRYDLPWLKAVKTEAKETAEAAASQSHHRHTREPGIILFRKNDNGKTSLLTLFLIGETPTSGIHKAALTNALEQAKLLNRKRKIISLMGPSYTGSATSLANTLRSWLEKHSDEEIKIISGGATGIKKREFLYVSDPSQTKDRVSFAATVTPTSTDMATFIDEYLKRLDNSQIKLAILRESNTVYGADIGQSITKVREIERQDQPQKRQVVEKLREELGLKSSTSSEPKRKEVEKPKPAQVTILELPFPLNISELRTEAEKANAESAKKNNGTDPAERKNVPLGMGQAKESTDAMPLLSKVEVAARELVLSNLLTTINREEITHLGLVASNVQDCIFLVREIRQHCPNAVIFTLNSDLLYLHPEARAEFRGVLLITPYSLFNPNQRWIYPYKGNVTRLQFPKPSIQGAYNGVLALMGKPDLMLEYGNPFDYVTADKNGNWRFLQLGETRKPALWVSVVGRDRVWPIKTLDYADSQQYLFTPSGVESLPTYAAVISVLHDKLSGNTASTAIADLPGIVNGAFSSKISLVGLLILSLICCVPSGVLLLNLMRTKLRRDINPFRIFRPEAAHENQQENLCRKLIVRLSAPIIPLRFALIKRITRSSLIKAIDRSRLAMIFGDPVLGDPKLKFKRRCYLMVCCLILLGIAWTIALVYLMPMIATIKIASQLPASPRLARIIWDIWWGGMSQYTPGYCMALSLLLLTLPASIWMVSSIVMWVIAWLNYNYFIPWKSKLERRQIEKKPFPLWLGWAAFLVLIVIKFRFAVTAGVLTATTIVYWDIIAPIVNPVSLIINRSAPEDVFFFLRTTDLTSGVSPMTPLLLVGIAAFLAFFSALRRLTLYERTCCGIREANKNKTLPLLNFEGIEQPSFVGLGALETRVKEYIRCTPFEMTGGWLFTLSLIAICFYLFFIRLYPTMEGKLFDWVFGLAFSISTIFLGLAFLRFVWLWVELRRLLRRLSWHPLFADDSNGTRDFFKRLPEINLTLPMSAYNSMAFSVEQGLKLANPKQLRISALLKEAKAAMRKGLQAESQGNWRISLHRRVKTQCLLAQTSNLLAQVLEPHWSTSINIPDNASSEERWIRNGKLFLASRVTSFLHHVLAQLQNLAALVTMGLMLMLLAISSYPFQPREPLLLFGWGAVLTVVVITVVIFVQMGRDKVMSLLSGTPPGHVTWSWDFTARILIHGLLPILALLGAQFPDVVGQIISWGSMLQGGYR